MVRIASTTLCLALVAFSSIAQAQSPPLDRRWDRLAVPLFTQTALPPECDPPTARAAASWNNFGSRLVYTGVGQLQTEDTAYVGRVVLRVGQTSTSTAGGTTERYPLGAPLGSTMNAARITINQNILFYNGSYYSAGGYNCAASNATADQVDYESVMVHELRHAWGRGHSTITPAS